MTKASSERIRALLLVVMAIFFANLLASGQLYYYIGPRLGWTVGLAVVLFVLLAGAFNLARSSVPASGAKSVDDGQEKSSVLPVVIVGLPVLLAIIITPHPLGARAVATRGVSASLGIASADNFAALNTLPEQRTILDWMVVLGASFDPEALAGQRADVTGFVYHDVRFDDNQFLITRFALTCCVADAQAIGLVVESPEATRLAADSWIRVQGVFGVGEVDGEVMPVLLPDEITPVQPPEQPYLYP